MINLRYFQLSEFECKCGCGANYMDRDHVLMLDNARDFARVPFIINSGHRCLKHNKDIGSKDTSSHIRGYASDINTPDSHTRFRVLYGVIMAGFKRIEWGTDGKWIHVDNDPNKPQEVAFNPQ